MKEIESVTHHTTQPNPNTNPNHSQADPQCAQVFLVSGRDVPVFPPRVLFHPRRVTTEGTRYRLRPFASIVCQAEPHWQDELKGGCCGRKKGAV